MTYPQVVTECQFTAGVWSDISPWVRHISIKRGVSRVESPILRYDTGSADIRLDNRDRRFEPTNLAGPYVESFTSDSGVLQFTCEKTATFGQGWTIDVKSAAGQDAEIRNAASVASGTTGSFSCAKPSGTVQGDKLVAFHFADIGALADLGTPTGGASWGTPLSTRSEGDSTLHCKAWEKSAGASEPSTYGFTQNSGADGIVIIVAIKAGTWDTGATPVLASTSNPERAVFDTPATVPAASNDLEIRAVAGSGNGLSGATWTPPQEAGWAELADRQSQSFITASLAVKQLDGVGGGTRTRVKPVRPIRVRAIQAFDATTNLVENPSVEKDANGWIPIGAGSGIARIPDVSRFGGYGLEVRRLAVNPPFNLYGTTAQGVHAGTAASDVVTISAWVYVPAASRPKVTAIAIGATGLASTDFVSIAGLQADTWHRVSRTATLTATLDDIQFQFWTDDTHADGQIVAYLDGAQAEKQPSATPYCDGSQPACSWGTPSTPPSTITEDFEDATLNITVTNGGNAAWARTSAQAQTGSWSFKSGTITHSQTTDAIVDVPAGATSVQFWYRVSSESGFDFFRFFTGAVQQLEASGTVGWTQSAVHDVSGVSTITFRYLKDGSLAAGEDAAYVDNLVFTIPGTGGGPGTPHASASSRPSAFTFDLFTGFADDWLIDWERTYDSEVTVPCTDALGTFADNDRAPVAAVGAGELSGARVTRILDSLGWPAADRQIAAGDTALQATTLAGNGLTELQLVADTEIGELYQDAGGKVVFRNRHAIVSVERSISVQARFGAGGEPQGRLPYHDVGIAYERAQIANQVRVTRVGGATQTASDQASITAYRVRTYEPPSELLMQSDAEALDSAQWVVYLSKEPELRYNRLVLRPQKAESLLFPQVLAREIGDRIGVERTPPGGDETVSREVFIRGIEHEIAGVGPLRWETAWVLQSAAKAGTFLVFGHPELGRLGRNALGY